VKILVSVYVRDRYVAFDRKWPHGVGSFQNSHHRATKNSLARLHKVVSKLVNERKCTISLFDKGYEISI
jgi:hypothetical protein